MIDIQEALEAVMIKTPERCSAHTMRRGTRWTCVRPEGHEGGHAAVDLTLRYWHPSEEGGPRGHREIVAYSRVEFRSRLLAREQDD